MMSRTTMAAVGGAMVAGVVALLAYSATASGATPAAAGGSLAFKAGHRYEIDFAIPANSGLASGNAPTATHVQTELDAIQSGAFHVVGVGVELPASGATDSGFTFYAIVDCIAAITVSQAALLTGSPAGTTVTATDNGLTSAAGTTTSSGTAAGNTATSTTTPVPAHTTVVGEPPQVGGTIPQWLTTITLGADSGNVAASYWPGDTISVQLPSGASWTSGGTQGVPTAGSAVYSFTAPNTLGTVGFAWSMNGTAYMTVVDFAQARTWTSATSWNPLDTVRLSLSNASYNAMIAAMPNDAAEAAALRAMGTQLAAAGFAGFQNVAQELFYILTTGPWPAALGIIANAQAILASAPTFQVWVSQSAGGNPANSWPLSQALPSDWPSDPDGAIRGEFQAVGIARRSLSSVPFPLLAWVRAT